MTDKTELTDVTDRQALIARLNSETAKISWQELQKHYASGNVLGVAAGADLIQVAIALKEDNATQIQSWLSDKSVFESCRSAGDGMVRITRPHFGRLVIPPFVSGAGA